MEIIIGEVSELGLESERVREFYSNHWKRKIALSIPSFYQWQFTQSPSDDGKDHCMVAINEQSGELYCAMGINKRPFLLNGMKLNGAELTTWIADDKYIGKGIGAKMLMTIQQRYDVLIGTGVSEMSLPILMRNGWRYIRAIPRYIRVYDYNKIEGYAESTPLAYKLVKKWKDVDVTQYTVSSLTKEEVDLIQEFVRDHYNYFIRDYEYLSWRYTSHPIFKYEQYLIRANGGVKGKGCIVCLRVEKNVKDLNVLHVMDFFGDPSDMPAALSFINEYCLDNDIHLADFYCTTTSISKYFISSGWFSINDDTCFQFPHLFHPIELRNPPTTSFIYWSKNDFVDMADTGRLYVTKEDADMDRPTGQTYQTK